MMLVKRGDGHAFRVLYERYRGQVFLYCLRILVDRDQAMDAMHDTFVRVYRNRDRYQSGTNFAGWIHTVARNLCLNEKRRDRRFSRLDDLEESDMSYDDQEGDVGLREYLAAEIARLPESYREALILREYEDRSYEDIVTMTGATMATIKFRLFKAREILRERLQWRLDDLHGRE